MPRKSSTKASSNKKTSSQANRKIHTVMKEYKDGKLHSGSKQGPKVRSRKQAIAIALSEAGVSKKHSSKKR